MPRDFAKREKYAEEFWNELHCRCFSIPSKSFLFIGPLLLALLNPCIFFCINFEANERLTIETDKVELKIDERKKSEKLRRNEKICVTEKWEKNHRNDNIERRSVINKIPKISLLFWTLTGDLFRTTKTCDPNAIQTIGIGAENKETRQ